MSSYKLMSEMPADLRPYEKCERYGAEVLSDPELLAVILKTGSREKSVLTLAEEILYSDGTREGLLKLMHYGMEDYRVLKGVGRVKALQLLCIAELAKRISRQKAEKHLDLQSPSTIADYYMEHLRHNNEEEVHLMLLDTRSAFLRSILVSRGTINSSAVSAREVFAAVLKHRAARFVMVHNHPSGRPDPSREDIMLTWMLLEGGQILNVPLIDSIIIGDRTYMSFLESGVMEQLYRPVTEGLQSAAKVPLDISSAAGTAAEPGKPEAGRPELTGHVFSCHKPAASAVAEDILSKRERFIYTPCGAFVE